MAEVFEIPGEPGRIRTCDPLIKSQLLYRLSYGPVSRGAATILRMAAGSMADATAATL